MRLYIIHALFICFALYGNQLSAQQYDPIAKPTSIIISGHARFTILTDHVIRMEYAKDSAFIDQASLTFVNRNLPVPSYSTTENNGWLIIQTKFSALHYLKNSGPFTSHNLYIEYKDPLHSFTWKPGMKDKKNLKGTTRTLDGVSGQFSYYGFKKLKLEDGVLSRSGWALTQSVLCSIIQTGPGSRAALLLKYKTCISLAMAAIIRLLYTILPKWQAKYPCRLNLLLVYGTPATGHIRSSSLKTS
jgi:hypothetical protein